MLSCRNDLLCLIICCLYGSSTNYESLQSVFVLFSGSCFTSRQTVQQLSQYKHLSRLQTFARKRSRCCSLPTRWTWRRPCPPIKCRSCCAWRPSKTNRGTFGKKSAASLPSGAATVAFLFAGVDVTCEKEPKPFGLIPRLCCRLRPRARSPARSLTHFPAAFSTCRFTAR